MALRKEELAKQSASDFNFEAPANVHQVRHKEATLAGCVAGISRQIVLASGLVRKYRYNNLLKLCWVQDSDGSYFRPDANGFWVRKKGEERFRVLNLAVDKEGLLHYDRQIGANTITIVENLDSSIIGQDQAGRLAYIELPGAGARSFEYDSSGQICRYTTSQGMSLSTTDGLVWRGTAGSRCVLYGLMTINEEGNIQFLSFNCLSAEINLNPATDQVLNPGDPLFIEALGQIFEPALVGLGQSKESTVEASELYKLARDRQMSGKVRLLAMMLWDFARRKRLKSVRSSDFAQALNLEAGKRAYTELVSKVVNLSNLSRRLETRKADLRCPIRKLPEAQAGGAFCPPTPGQEQALEQE